MMNPDSTPEQYPSNTTAQAPPQPSPSAAPQSDYPVEQQQQQHYQDQQPSELNYTAQQQPHLAPPPFRSLFALVTDSTGATHHPRIHYIFQDDDPDILTDMLAQQQEDNQQPAAASSGSKATPAAPPTNRTIILDLAPKPAPSDAPAPAGYEVAHASSLSADWAVVSATLAPMGGAGDASTPSPTVSDRLMLRIEGVDLRPAASSNAPSASSSSRGAHQQQEDYNALVDDFDARMAVLRKVVDAGAERQAKLAADGAGARHEPSGEPSVTGAFENMLTLG